MLCVPCINKAISFCVSQNADLLLGIMTITIYRYGNDLISNRKYDPMIKNKIYKCCTVTEILFAIFIFLTNYK